MQHQNSHIFLAEPIPISELNNWIAEYQNSQQRFTFTEAEVLQTYWEQGEDILLREDNRFKEVALPDLAYPQWRLSIHTLANQCIFESLLDDAWDGEDLCHYLQQLDQQSDETLFHVFCLADQRFSLSQNAEGCYHISLSQQMRKVNLNAEQKQALEDLADKLLEAFPQQRRSPWTIFEIVEQVKRLSAADFPSLEVLLPAELTQWLRRQDGWAQVGRDLWFPRHLLPSPAQNRRYAVLSIKAGKNGQIPSLLTPMETNEQSANETMDQEIPVEEPSSTSRQTPERNRWKVTLLTLHLNEGYIPIPPQMRGFYPHDRNKDTICMLPGIWFADASEMTVWLDLERHRLYGPDITDQLAFLDAGTILGIFGSNAGFTFSMIGQDPDIFEEEARLIDITELAQMRSSLLESYRTSLRLLLASAQQGNVFSELYLELCQRQQHKPNRSTIRAILSSSPEFFFDKSEKKWKLLSGVSEETGASALRKVAVTAQQITSDSGSQPSDMPSLATMIARNHQQLIDLRKVYGHKNEYNA